MKFPIHMCSILFHFNDLLIIYIFIDHFLDVVYLMVTWYALATYIFAFGSLSWISWMLSNLCNIQFSFKCIFPPKFQITIWNFPKYADINPLFLIWFPFVSLNFFVRKKHTNTQQNLRLNTFFLASTRWFSPA